MQPTFEYLLINVDDAPTRLTFVTIDQDKMTEFWPSAAVVPNNHGCRPLFVMVKGEKVEKVIEGCNAPLMLQTVARILDVEF